jgi:hypothetical protein
VGGRGRGAQPTRHLVLDMRGVPGVDSSAATGLRELHDGLLARNVSLEIAPATDSLETAMDRLGSIGTKGRLRCAASLSMSEDVYARNSSQ